MFAAPLAAQSMRGALYAYVGCYTTAQRNARGDGIHVYRIDPQTGAWTHVQRVGDLVNPSFLVMAADQRHLYSVHGDETYATAFSVDRATGFLQAVNRAETGGRNGVHQAIAQDGRFMVVANYGSGNVAVLPIRPDGALADAVQVVVLPGQPGPHRIEQTSSHPHHVVFDPERPLGNRTGQGPGPCVRFSLRCGDRQIDAQRSGRRDRSRRVRPAACGVPSPVCQSRGWSMKSRVRSRRTLGTRSAAACGPHRFCPHCRATIQARAPPRRLRYRRTDVSSTVPTADTTVSLRSHPIQRPACLLPPVGHRRRAARRATLASIRLFRFCVRPTSSPTRVITYRADAATGRLAVTGSPVQNASPVSIAFATGS